MSQISLTASMRSNLLSLQATADLMSQTQERLSTGKKVNSAIDNPSSYYTAQSLNNRANDLSSLLDSMGQAVSTIKAANEGIESITSFVEQAKAVAQSAVDTTDIDARAKYAEQFNSLMDQINFMADDSGYKGINLLKGEDLTVKFSENGSNLDIEGVDATYDTGLKISKIDIDDGDWAGKVESVDVSSPTATVDDADELITPSVAAGKLIKVGDSDYYITTKATTDNKKIAQLVELGEVRQLANIGGSYYDAVITVANTTTAIGGAANTPADKIIKAGDDYYLTISEADKAKTVSELVADGVLHKLTAGSDALYDLEAGAEDINESIKQTTAAINTLRTYASSFGNNYSIVQTREEFTNNLINVLEEGADKLTLADMNEESANMLALQTRQQLAINSLSLASQAAQSVLRLFS